VTSKVNDDVIITERDTIQVTSSGGAMNIMLPDKVELRVTVLSFSQGSPEQFISHVQTALETIRHRQKGLLAAYDTACKEYKKAEQKLVKAPEAFSSYLGTDENPTKKKALKKATDSKTHTSEAKVLVTVQVFMIYSNLLKDEARQPWTKIVETDLF